MDGHSGLRDLGKDFAMIERLEGIRNLLHCTWAQLAAVLQTSRKTLSQIRSGKIKESSHISFMISMVEDLLGINQETVSMIVPVEFRKIINELYFKIKDDTKRSIISMSMRPDCGDDSDLLAIAARNYTFFSIELRNRGSSFTAWAKANTGNASAARRALLNPYYRSDFASQCRIKMAKQIRDFRKG